MAYPAATNKKSTRPTCCACLDVSMSKQAVWQRQAAMVDSFHYTGLFPSRGLVFSPPATPQPRQPTHKAKQIQKTTTNPQCSPLAKLRCAWRKRSASRKDTLTRSR
jgi:hypothetical protein